MYIHHPSAPRQAGYVSRKITACALNFVYFSKKNNRLQGLLSAILHSHVLLNSLHIDVPVLLVLCVIVTISDATDM